MTSALYVSVLELDWQPVKNKIAERKREQIDFIMIDLDKYFKDSY